MASTYLSRTPASAGNRRTFTYSTWLKLSTASVNQTFLCTGSSGTSFFQIYVGSTGRIGINDYDAGGNFYNISWATPGNYVLRDPSAWYHFIMAVDTTQASASDRIKIYLNGEDVTSNFTQTTTPAQNTELNINNTIVHRIGQDNEGSTYWDGSMAHIHFIDGTQYAASDFGSFDANGIWTPNAIPSVTYGTNGFFLDMASSGDMGNDVSGNNNDFTVTGTVTQALDTPSNVFATLNPLSSVNYPTFSNGNNSTVISTSDANGAIARGTLFVSKGKWYWEVKLIGYSNLVRVEIGVETADSVANNIAAPGLFGTGKSRGRRGDANTIKDGNVTSSYSSNLATNDIVGVALDVDNGTLTFYTNGVSQGVAFSDLANDTWAIALGQANDTFQINTGNGYFGTTAVASGNADSAGLGIFEYTVPSGYYSLCTKNIATYG